VANLFDQQEVTPISFFHESRDGSPGPIHPLSHLRGGDTSIHLPADEMSLESALREIASQASFELIIAETVDPASEVRFRELEATCKTLLHELSREYDLHYNVLTPTKVKVDQWSNASRKPSVASLDPGGKTPLFLAQPLPQYPQESWQAQVEARLLIRFSIDERGHARPYLLVRCFMNDSFHGPIRKTKRRCSRFRDAAFDALRQWKTPLSYKGDAGAEYIANVAFKLKY